MINSVKFISNLKLQTMKHEYFEQILENNTILVETNTKLVSGTSKLIENNTILIENNTKVVNFVTDSLTRNEDLLKVAIQIYQALSDKEKKTVIEDSWYNGLKKVFQEAQI